MGQRPGAVSGIEIFAAFLEKNEWRQRDLAAKVGLSERAARACLETLAASGLPLERLPAPPTVRWRLPEGWLPSGIVLSKKESLAVGRYLARHKSSDERNELLAKLLGVDALAWARTERAEVPSEVLRQLEDARRSRVAARILYRSASGAHPLETRERLVSVAHVAYDGHERFIGIERGATRPKIYRVDRVSSVALDPSGFYRAVPPEELEELLRNSIHGFHGGDTAEEHAFTVRAPESQWARGNLPVSATAARIDDLDDGRIRVRIRTAAPDVLARYVVGLGDAACSETEGLRERVARIAEGALRVAGPPPPSPAPGGPGVAKPRGRLAEARMRRVSGG